MNKEKTSHLNLGQAGEFRVASELLLRRYNPFLASLDKGVDIILEIGTRIQVKAGTLRYEEKGQRYVTKAHLCRHGSMMRDGHRRNVADPMKNVDFVIIWIPNIPKKDFFYIIPVDLVRGKKAISLIPYGSSKWNKFIDAWYLLKETASGPLDKLEIKETKE